MTTKKKTTAAASAPVDIEEPLRQRRAQLLKEKEQLANRTASIREQRDALGNQIRELERQAEIFRLKLVAIEHPRLPEIDAELSRIAQLLGGRRMSEGQG